MLQNKRLGKCFDEELNVMATARLNQRNRWCVFALAKIIYGAMLRHLPVEGTSAPLMVASSAINVMLLE